MRHAASTRGEHVPSLNAPQRIQNVAMRHGVITLYRALQPVAKFALDFGRSNI